MSNRFRIEHVLGRGNYAIVYAATNVVTGKQFALKWPRKPGMSGAILREAQAAARVRHPSVVDVYDVGEHDGTLFLLMEHLRAPTLRHQLAYRVLRPRCFFSVIDAVIDCLHAVHESGLVHCDLKPSNILVFAGAKADAIRTKLIDFGSVKVLDAASGFGELRRSASHPGTLPYAPPEQLENSPSLDQRADIYALGVILRRALCSGSAGTGESPLWGAIRRATAEEPSRRFRSVLEFQDALRLGRAAHALPEALSSST